MNTGDILYIEVQSLNQKQKSKSMLNILQEIPNFKTVNQLKINPFNSSPCVIIKRSRKSILNVYYDLLCVFVDQLKINK